MLSQGQPANESIRDTGYNNFNKKKIVERAAEELVTNLRLVQSKAINKEKDCLVCGGSADCSDLGGVLEGWKVDFSSNTFWGVCPGQSFSIKELVNLDIDGDTSDDLKITSGTATVLFLPWGSTDLNGDLTVTVSYLDDSDPLTVTIEEGGNIE